MTEVFNIFSHGDKAYGDDWQHRLLYFTDEGSTCWLDFSNTDIASYLSEFSEDIHEISNAISTVSFSVILSLGPGDGLKDFHVIKRLHKPITYIPIDISTVFVKNAAAMLKAITHVPFAIASDFEMNFSSINQLIGEKIKDKPKLYSLLGNTLGALDKRETHFLKNFAESAGPKDSLILEIGLTKENWNFFEDSSSLGLFRDPKFQRFLATSLIVDTEETIDDVLKEFDSRVRVRSSLSDVPGATSYAFYDVPTDTDIFRLTRFSWTGFLTWISGLSPRLRIVFSKRYDYQDLNLGTGIVILACV